MTPAEHHADAVLRAAGSSMRHYTMPGTRAAICEAMQDALNAAYFSGFMESSEGWNGEYPYADRGESPTSDPNWLDVRNRCIGAGAGSRQLPQRHPYGVRPRCVRSKRAARAPDGGSGMNGPARAIAQAGGYIKAASAGIAGMARRGNGKIQPAPEVAIPGRDCGADGPRPAAGGRFGIVLIQTHREILAAELAHARARREPYLHIEAALRQAATALMRAEIEARQ